MKNTMQKYERVTTLVQEDIGDEDLKILTDYAKKNSEYITEVIKTAYKIGRRRGDIDAYDNYCHILGVLERGSFALDTLTDTYDYEYTPNLVEALKYADCRDKEECEKNVIGKRSFQYICEYKNIMWLSNVALDYVSKSIDKCKEKIDEIGG